LRRRRIDASTASAAALLAVTDVEQLNHAHRDGRVFVTQDTTYDGHILQMLVLLFDVLTAEEMVGRVGFL
jgi:hypothetical protein